jgi:hypothetical protein
LFCIITTSVEFKIGKKDELSQTFKLQEEIKWQEVILISLIASAG